MNADRQIVEDIINNVKLFKMKIKFLALSFFIGTSLIPSQMVVVNEQLMFQLSKNQAVRLASNEAFLKSYEKQKELLR